MKIQIDTDNKQLILDNKELPLYSKEAFELLSQLWVKVGWDQKYTYTFSWMGRPIIQLPEDMVRMQEVIYRIKPDVIVETGVAHGGSLIYYSGLCKILEKGRVIGVDIEIRSHNRQAIENHELASYITLVEGDSVATDTVEKVKSLIKPHESVLVILDSCHTKDHVWKELEMYSPLVSKDSYIVVTDGIMQELYDVPNGNVEWKFDNPTQAALEFASNNSEFKLEQPEWLFNESRLNKNITYWPYAFLKKVN